MKEITKCSVEELKEAIWHLNNGREPGGGPYGYTVNEVRAELYSRTGEFLGHHEEPYQNEDGECECHKCELAFRCVYRERYQRLPKTVPGALGLCPKL